MADLHRRLQGLRHHLQRLLAGHEGGEEGHSGAGLGHHRDRVAGHQRGVRVRQHVHAAEELDQADRDEHHHVERGQPVEGRIVALGPVLGLEQPEQQHQGQHRGRGQHQGDPDAVRLLRDQRAVLHLVRLVRIGLGEGTREPAVVLVVVSRQRLLDPPECPRGAHPVPRHPELGGLGRVVVLPGTRGPRRHESSPHTRTAACFVASYRLLQVPLDLHRRISGGSQSPRHPHPIDTATRPSGCMMPPSASVHERGPYSRPAGNRFSLPPNCRESRSILKNQITRVLRRSS